jgi:hypothetical protein
VSVVQHIEERPDLQVCEERMTEAGLSIDLVAVAPALLDPHEEPLGTEVGDDFLDGTLADADLVGDLADPDGRLAGDAEEDVAVVRQEEPRRRSDGLFFYYGLLNHGS